MENWRKYVKEIEDQSQADLTEGADVSMAYAEMKKKPAFENLMDGALKRIAPVLIRRVLEQEINEDMEDFLMGAIEGRHEKQQDWAAKDPSPKTYDHPEGSDYTMGYDWGWQNADKWAGNELPPEARKARIESQIQEYENKITEEMVQAALKKAASKLYDAMPHQLLKLIWKAGLDIHKIIKDKGWVAGFKEGAIPVLGAIVNETLDNFILPAAMISLGLPPVTVAFGVGDIVNPYLLRKVGGDDDESRKYQEELADELGWYEEKFGDVPSLGKKKKAKE